MIRSDIPELHYITPIANLPSIMELGILSNKRASSVGHISVAMEEIQDKRRQKKIPGAGHLHDYVNLYFDAHNPMLSKRRDKNSELCILRVDPKVLDINGVIVADCNAASSYAKFLTVEEGLPLLDKDLIYAKYWNHEDLFEKWSRGAKKCAEVLVPDVVPCEYIKGAYVINQDIQKAVLLLRFSLPVTIDNGIFF